MGFLELIPMAALIAFISIVAATLYTRLSGIENDYLDIIMKIVWIPILGFCIIALIMSVPFFFAENLFVLAGFDSEFISLFMAAIISVIFGFRALIHLNKNLHGELQYFSTVESMFFLMVLQGLVDNEGIDFEKIDYVSGFAGVVAISTSSIWLFGFITKTKVTFILDKILLPVWFVIGLFSFIAFFASFGEINAFSFIGISGKFTNNDWVGWVSAFIFFRSIMHVLREWKPRLVYLSTAELLFIILILTGAITTKGMDGSKLFPSASMSQNAQPSRRQPVSRNSSSLGLSVVSKKTFLYGSPAFSHKLLMRNGNQQYIVRGDRVTVTKKSGLFIQIKTDFMKNPAWIVKSNTTFK